MMRVCSHCQRPFAAQDLVREDSRTLERERRRRGVEGLHFYCYHCAGCGFNDIFLDMQKRAGETDDDFCQRRHVFEAMAREMHGAVDVVVTSR